MEGDIPRDSGTRAALQGQPFCGCVSQGPTLHKRRLRPEQAQEPRSRGTNSADIGRSRSACVHRSARFWPRLCRGDDVVGRDRSRASAVFHTFQRYRERQNENESGGSSSNSELSWPMLERTLEPSPLRIPVYPCPRRMGRFGVSRRRCGGGGRGEGGGATAPVARSRKRAPEVTALGPVSNQPASFSSGRCCETTSIDPSC